VTFRADLKLPLGSLDELTGSGGLDAGAGLEASAAVAPWLTAHALASVRAVSRFPRAFPLQPRRIQGAGELSLVARFGNVALLLEDRLVSALLQDGWSVSPDVREPEATAYYGLFRAHNQVSGGIRYRSVTVFLSEDFTPGRRLATDPGPRWFYDSNAPDVVLGVAWARTL
jgi:hypothetical protein